MQDLFVDSAHNVQDGFGPFLWHILDMVDLTWFGFGILWTWWVLTLAYTVEFGLDVVQKPGSEFLHLAAHVAIRYRR